MSSSAIITLGGKQYLVRPQQRLYVDKLDAPLGQSFSAPQVLWASNGQEVYVGHPHLNNVTVVVSHNSHEKGDKVIIFKKKRRHNYRRTNGYRASLSSITIQDITFGSASTPASPTPASPTPASPIKTSSIRSKKKE